MYCLSLSSTPNFNFRISALAFMIPGASESITNPSFHGISQVMYEMTSAAANNQSGLKD